MHDTAYAIGLAAMRIYAPREGMIVEIGSADVNGSLRLGVPPETKYVGLDLASGAGVDVVMAGNASLPVAAGVADMVIATSVLEHDDTFWETFIEACRIAKVGGFIYLNVPSNGKVHHHPLDCWRFYPDAGLALERYSRRSLWPSTLVESFIADRREDCWNDFVAVFRRGEGAVVPRQRLSDLFAGRSARTIDSPKEEAHESWPEDMIIIRSLRERIEQLERECQLRKAMADNSSASGEGLASKILMSPFTSAEKLPLCFDPVRYLALHKDLFDANVDPYEHYIQYGRSENRRL